MAVAVPPERRKKLEVLEEGRTACHAGATWEEHPGSGLNQADGELRARVRTRGQMSLRGQGGVHRQKARGDFIGAFECH